MKKDDVEKDLKEALDPASLGFIFRDVRDEGLRASSQSVNFTQLFLGLSFFIIIAAFVDKFAVCFNTENRSEENGLFLAWDSPRKP